MQVVRPLPTVEARGVKLVAVDQRVDKLARPVSAKVEVNDDVTVTDAAVYTFDHRRLYEFIALPAGVAVEDGCQCRLGGHAHAVHNRVITLLGALPTLVAVHREIPSANRRDPRDRVSSVQSPLEIGHELRGRSRRCVAAVQQAVDDDVRGTMLGGQCCDGDGVPVDRVDAPRPEQADQMQSVPAGPVHGLQQHRVARQGAIRHGGVDARQVLEDRPPGPDVEVTNLAVTHLSGGQPNRFARRLQQGMRPCGQQPPPDGHMCLSDCVVGRTIARAKAVDDD